PATNHNAAVGQRREFQRGGVHARPVQGGEKATAPRIDAAGGRDLHVVGVPAGGDGGLDKSGVHVIVHLGSLGAGHGKAEEGRERGGPSHVQSPAHSLVMLPGGTGAAPPASAYFEEGRSTWSWMYCLS